MQASLSQLIVPGPDPRNRHIHTSPISPVSREHSPFRERSPFRDPSPSLRHPSITTTATTGAMDSITHAFGEDYDSHPFTTLHVEQSYFTWVSRNTGRGFKISTSPSSPPLFTVQSQNWGKHRTLHSPSGAPICEIKRNWLSKHSAWELSHNGELLVSINIEWLRTHINLSATTHDSVTGQKYDSAVVAEATDVWGGKFNLRAGPRTFMTVKCGNMSEGWKSAFKVSPPIWEVQLAEGANLVLAAVLAVCISDAYSESHGFML
ncbi:hypothetical protein K461DRAFT_274043 [Myriangium duriaei CBS 260.36]|uniref:Uncharacterized protein n=1 Tax=Myriangium duriaei CBS 260.36 TaxID=1168546 RepID=A0A9P4MSS0_9PEZI|nr:hypothetical protein K461DRAFT_274043 [Myriangium duriaei CBS 260.36]